MKHFSRILAATLALAAISLSVPQSAQAANIYLCAPPAVAAGNPGRVTNPGASGGSYVLNNKGCALISIANSDAAYFQSQGYTQGPNLFSVTFVSGVMTSTTSVAITPPIPANAAIRDIYISNTTANAVTGGIDIGTTSGGNDVVSAKTCAANCLAFVADAALLKRVFSLTAAQGLFITGHTDANSANLTLTITYSYF